VSVGQRVVAGETVLGTIPHASPVDEASAPRAVATTTGA